MILRATISRTAQGDKDYMQILSDDSFSVNIVLVVDRIEVNDVRPAGKKRGK